MDAKLVLERFEAINSKVAKRSEAAQREKISLEYDKKELVAKMDALKAKGLTFTNATELKEELDRLAGELSNALDATERKLNS